MRAAIVEIAEEDIAKLIQQRMVPLEHRIAELEKTRNAI